MPMALPLTQTLFLPTTLPLDHLEVGGERLLKICTLVINYMLGTSLGSLGRCYRSAVHRLYSRIETTLNIWVPLLLWISRVLCLFYKTPPQPR
ncbi:hypothetical protein F4824DRAFT_469439 [Ustulina deusta]|nr:hypothetical protein F4824DRAFT_469439 [Ustulina deusta]